jgi:hypothetical protein
MDTATITRGPYATCTAGELLAGLRAMGCCVTRHGGAIRLAPSEGILTTTLREAIKARKAELLALLDREDAPQPQAVSVAPTQASAPLTPTYPCVVCSSTERWYDRGVWRCVACWPKGGVLVTHPMASLLACRRCDSMAPPVGDVPKEDGSVLMRCAECKLPRMAIRPENESD